MVKGFQELPDSSCLHKGEAALHEENDDWHDEEEKMVDLFGFLLQVGLPSVDKVFVRVVGILGGKIAWTSLKGGIQNPLQKEINELDNICA